MERKAPDTFSLLLIEDDVLDRKALERVLARTTMSIQLTCAGDIEGGLLEISRRPFECVLLDWHLPDGMGGEFLERVAEKHPEVPVVVLTGSDDPSLVKEALSFGAQDYLVKSEFSPSMLERAVRYAIDRKQSEQLRARIVKVERLRSIGQLASGVAHEINNPAGWITANLEFMIETIEEAAGPTDKLVIEGAALKELRELLDECQQGISRISDIVRALRTYAEASREKIEPVDLNFVVEQATQVTSSELRWRARIITDLDPDLPTIDGDLGTLVQSLVHILMNASQSIERVKERRDHHIQIRTQVLGNQISLVVTDSGVGVDANIAERVFEPFVASPSYRTGMGLAVVSDVIEQHGGTARFIPHDGHGASIELLLPLGSEVVDDAEPPTIESITRGDGTSMRILIVDDEPHMQRMFRRLFGSEHDIHIVDGIEESVDLLEQQGDFDGILINLLRFEKVAMEWLEAVAGFGIDLQSRVVVCTAGSAPASLQQFLDTSCAETLQKPFELSDLQTIFAHWFRLREQRLLSASPEPDA